MPGQQLHTYILKYHHLPQAINILTSSPVAKEKSMINARYSKKRLTPNTIFSAPRLVSLVDGPVSMNAEALPMLMPE